MSLPPPPRKGEQRAAKVKHLIVARVVSLYRGATGRMPKPSALREVERDVDMLVRAGTVPDAEVRRLAYRLRRRRSPHDDSGIGSTTHGGGMDCGDGSGMGGLLPPLHPTGYTQPARDVAPSTEQSPSRRRQERAERDLWAQLAKHDVERHRGEEERRVQQRREKMRQQKQVLDDQMAEAAQARAQQRAEDEKVARLAALQQEQWQLDAAQKREEQQRAIRTERMQQKEIFNNARNRREQQERQRREDEVNEVERIRAEINKENERKEERKIQHKADVQRFMQFNQEQKAVKMQQRMTELARDRELHAQFLARLDRQEQDRAEALQKMYDRQQRQVAMGSEVAKGMNEKAAEDERRADVEQRRLVEKAEEDERRRRRRCEEEKQRVRDCLAQQIRDKESQRLLERREAAERRAHAQREAEDAVRSEVEKRRRRREADVRNRRELDDQIRARVEGSGKETMSTHERRLNQRLLGQLHQRGSAGDGVAR